MTARIGARVQLFADFRNYVTEPDWFGRILASDNLTENVRCLNVSGSVGKQMGARHSKGLKRLI
jgi:hypothetical protein